MYRKRGTILVVDDNKSVVIAIKMLLSNVFEKVLTLQSPKELITTLRTNVVDVVLLDMNFVSGVNNGNEGLYWLSQIISLNLNIEVVLFTAYGDIDLAVKGMQNGASNFIVKPWDNTKLINTLKEAYEKHTSRINGSDNQLTEGGDTAIGISWGTSAAMQRVKSLIEKVAPTDANILITGENGTGKEVLAREIHNLSLRRNKQLVTVDMGAITDSLFESELFGHIKGAFTDARADRAGKFEAATGSSLFLDEIGNLPMHMQAKLLSVLQTRKIVRVGSNQEIDIDIRLIAATNCNITQMVSKGGFREDLLYRINTISIEIPPLRERVEDIMPMAKMFLDRYKHKYNKAYLTFAENVAPLFKRAEWRGNVRELQHLIEKSVIVADNKVLSASDFRLTEFSKSTSSENPETIEDMERQMIITAMQKYEANLSQVAMSLGITRQTLYNKMKKYNL